MRTRILGPDEWGRLESPLLPYVAPRNVAVIVAQKDDEIVGSLLALQVTHLEGIWVDPRHRSGIVPRALLRQAYAVGRAREESWLLGGVADGDGLMGGYIHRLGGSCLPMRFHVMPVRDC